MGIFCSPKFRQEHLLEPTNYTLARMRRVRFTIPHEDRGWYFLGTSGKEFGLVLDKTKNACT